VPFYGADILCLDNEVVQKILPRVSRRTITYGTSAQADLVITGVTPGTERHVFSLEFRGRDLGRFQLQVPGMHNVRDAAAAVAVALELEIAPETIRDGLASYEGVDRRFQKRGEAGGVTLIDDYGHHPTEIRATLETARACGYSRVLVLFQPHRYSRTSMLMDEFGTAFHQADGVFVVDIYAASEEPQPGVTSEALVARIREFGHRSVQYAGTLEQGMEAIAATAGPGDLVLTLGAGSVARAGDQLLRLLEER